MPPEPKKLQVRLVIRVAPESSFQYERLWDWLLAPTTVDTGDQKPSQPCVDESPDKSQK